MNRNLRGRVLHKLCIFPTDGDAVNADKSVSHKAGYGENP